MLSVFTSRVIKPTNLPVLAEVQKRFRRRSMPKPRPRARLDLAGNVKVNTTRLVNFHRWKPEKVEKMLEFVKNSYESVKTLPEGERLPTLQSMLDAYIESMWGAKMARLRYKARESRRLRLKARGEAKMRRKTLDWHRVQDIKELRVMRERARLERQQTGELFSFRRFLAEWKESRRKPIVIEPAEEFEANLEKLKQKMYFRGPRILRQPLNPKAGYYRRYQIEVLAPLLHHLKKKAWITKLVQERQDKIKAKKVAEELAVKRAARAEQKKQHQAAKQEYWNKVLGAWHAENDKLTQLKREYYLAREKVLSESRKEFLAAMNEDVHLWQDNPDECKFLRFAVAEGVDFPYNRTPYY